MKPNLKKTKKIVIRTAIVLGGVVFLVVGLYLWAICRPTGYERFLEKGIHEKENVVVLEDKVRERYSSSSEGLDIKEKYKSRDFWLGLSDQMTLFRNPLLGNWALYWNARMYVKVIHDDHEVDKVFTDGVPDEDLIRWMTKRLEKSPYGQHSKYLHQFGNVEEYEELGFNRALDLCEQEFFETDKNMDGLDQIQDNLYDSLRFRDNIAWSLYRTGLRGDREKFQRHLIEFTELSLALHRMTFGNNQPFQLNQLIGLMIVFEEKGFLDQEMVDELQDLCEEARFQESEIDQYVYQLNLRHVENVRNLTYFIKKDLNTYHYMRDGGLEGAVNSLIYPIFSKKVDDYGVCWMQGEFEGLEPIMDDLSSLLDKMNYVENDLENMINYPSYHPLVTTNTRAIWCCANEEIWVLEYLLASIHYKMDHDDWPDSDTELLGVYIDNPFPEEKRLGLRIVKVPDLTFLPYVHCYWAHNEMNLLNDELPDQPITLEQLKPLVSADVLEKVQAEVMNFKSRQVFFTFHLLEDPMGEGLSKDKYPLWSRPLWKDSRKACQIKAYFSPLPEVGEYLDQINFSEDVP